MRNQEIDESCLKKINRAQKHMLRASELVNRFGSPNGSKWTCYSPSDKISIMKMTPVVPDIKEIRLTSPMFHVMKGTHTVVEDDRTISKQFKKAEWIPYERLAVQQDKSTFLGAQENGLFLWAQEFSLDEQRKLIYAGVTYLSWKAYYILNIKHSWDTDENREKKMKEAARAYVEANKDVKELLESTGSHDLKYFTNDDNELGIKWDKNGEDGKNMLGKVFMDIRLDIKLEKKSAEKKLSQEERNKSPVT